MKSKKGLTVLELLSALSLGMLLITFSFSAIGSFLSRIEISGAVSTITSCLSEARYISVSASRKVRFQISENTVSLQVKQGIKWIPVKNIIIKGNINLNSNASPVFNPKGTSSPLCSIRISNKMYGYIITLSFAGRIKIGKM